MGSKDSRIPAPLNLDILGFICLFLQLLLESEAQLIWQLVSPSVHSDPGQWPM